MPSQHARSCKKTARTALLTYVSDANPGIRRLPYGTGFRYQRPDGFGAARQYAGGLAQELHHPPVIEAYQNCGLAIRERPQRRAATARLPAEEDAVLRLLECGLAGRRRRARAPT
jgi:DNA topoisomerase IB